MTRIQWPKEYVVEYRKDMELRYAKFRSEIADPRLMRHEERLYWAAQESLERDLVALMETGCAPEELQEIMQDLMSQFKEFEGFKEKWAGELSALKAALVV